MIAIACANEKAQAQTKKQMVWVTPAPGADLVKLKAAIEAAGGTILTLAPEGRLLVRYRAAGLAAPTAQAVEPYTAPPAGKVLAAEPTEHGLGMVRPTPEEEARLDARRVTWIEPNTLSGDRATLQGLASLPSAVDNSLSTCFPPVSSQGQLSACTAWATTYYYNTYEQARDEGWNAASGNTNNLSNPMFVYNLINGGLNTGTSIEDAMCVLNTSGAACKALRSSLDVTLWPTEAEWVDALKRRTLGANVIGSWYLGCDDDDILAIKQHLANGHIAVTLADIYDNLYYYYPANTTGVNSQVLFANGTTAVGGHAMTIVGYDDNKAYYTGTQWKYGAFLLANSWGSNWGTTNTGSTGGFLWVAYDYFKTGPVGGGYYVFGTAYFNDDRPQYRSRLYAAAGLNHAQRGYVIFHGGIGSSADPYWESDDVIAYSGGTSTAIDDGKRVVVDLNDGIPYIAFPTVDVFARMDVSRLAAGNGTLTNTTFYYDFDGDGTYEEAPATNTPRTVAPGGGADALAVFTWSDGLIDHLTMDTVGSPQYVGVPLAATITARDNLGRIAGDFNATATLAAANITTSTVGNGTVAAWIPLATYYLGVRTQTIYLQSEIGAAGILQGLALNVSEVPGRSLQNFTIRLKHTAQSAFTSPTWESGFTTVYQHPTTISTTGWVMFAFDTPFMYNGTDNLMVDFSFNNPTYADTDGYVLHTNTGANRTSYGGGDWGTNPLNWTGTSPALLTTSLVPNARFISGHILSISPTATGNFTAGVWSGAITFAEPAENAYLIFYDAAGHAGLTNTFNILASSPGSLTVTLGPPEAVAAGAQWRRSGTSTWRAGGSTETGIPAGSYTIEFCPVPGWVTPATQPVTIASGGAVSTAATYAQMSSVWVDFAYGLAPFGTQDEPFSLLGPAVAAVTPGGTVYVKAGTSNEHPRITKAVRIQSVGGSVTIGR